MEICELIKMNKNEFYEKKKRMKNVDENFLID